MQLRLRGRDPCGGAAGEGVEGSDGGVEVVLAGVLDLVVGDAAEALDEEHDGGDAGAADLGGVVERAAGEAVGDARAHRLKLRERNVKAVIPRDDTGETAHGAGI